MPPSYSTKPYPIYAGRLGYVEGLTISNGATSQVLCHYLGGIPYALPPTGPFRFRRPRALPAQYKLGTKANPARFTGGTGVCPQPGFRAPPDKSLWDEDCLQLNIWTPAGKSPAGGWPVFFYIHGGFLQWGNANTPATAHAELLGETAFKCMIVMPAYRLNVFGFIAGRELEAEAQIGGESAGNMGFWDQRLALEWTARHIANFGGNAQNITVGGYSAGMSIHRKDFTVRCSQDTGSHSTFQQLAHDLFLPKESSIIKRAIMWSNGPGVQPKFLDEHQKQFDELLTALNIPLNLSPSEKLSRLRATSADAIVAVQDSLAKSEFRAISDGSFISNTLIRNINDGTFARRVLERGVKILNGECRDEHYLYGAWRTPANSFEAVYYRLVADYPEETVKMLIPIYFPNRDLPAWAKDWPDAFGKVYADMQVHASERGFADRLEKGGLVVGRDLLRYRIDWRAKCVDTALPREWKVTHSSDFPIWFWGLGMGDGLTPDEKIILRDVNAFFAAFVKGDDVQWSELGSKWLHRLNGRGALDMWKDERWEDGITVWNAVNGDEKPPMPASHL